ncbi:MAG: hypothetical protein NT078_00945 [Candidatus Azambacteria bacterium]|nr:hypothetical protein [Candidatus Azambacteria bacterium]
MILASHIIVSGLLGATTQNYFLAAIFGFVSHYILDAIPHWDFYLSPEFNVKAEAEDGKFIKEKFFWKEVGKIVIDILIGLGLLFIFLKKLSYINTAAVFISVFFSILPDSLNLLYRMTGWKLIKWNSDIQDFAHYSIHSKIDQKFWPGIIIQISTIGIVFLILYTQ